MLSKTMPLHIENEGVVRTLIVHFEDESDDHDELIRYFDNNEVIMYHSIGLPEEAADRVRSLTDEEANNYLKANPVKRIWEGVAIRESSLVSDSDLARLAVFEDLSWIRICNSSITEVGVKSLFRLKNWKSVMIAANISDPTLVREFQRSYQLDDLELKNIDSGKIIAKAAG